MPDFKNTVGGRFLTMLEAQAPANFAMVMSTGIVSVALHLLDYPIGARLLFWLNAALCVGLALLYIIRLFVFPKRFVQDFRSHGAGPGFLTVVAGICILGNQFVLLGKDPAMGEALFWIGSVLWIVILWGVFYFVFSDEPKPPLEKGINGAWLVATVSTQAIVILGCILIDHMPWDKEIAFPGILGHGVPIGDVHRMYGHAGEVSESGIPVAVAGSLRVRGAGGVDGGFLWYGHHKAGNAPEGGLPDGIASMGRLPNEAVVLPFP